MRQLSGLDVSFLNMESATTYGHVSSLNIFDPGDVEGAAGVEATKRLLLERMELLEPFRRRLVQVPLGVDLPYWAEDPDFDIDFHVRGHAVASPGTDEQLAEAIARIHARPLDRNRPLWELYVIEGYRGGRYIAQLTKVHHATIDGASGALMLGSLLDTDPDVRVGREPVFEWSAPPIPDSMAMLKRTALEFLRRPEKTVRLTTRALRETAAASRNGGVRLLAETLAQPMPGPVGEWMRARLRGPEDPDRPDVLPVGAAPKTPWNATISPHRRFAFTTIPLDEARQVRRATGATFNDVVMAICSGMLRRYLLEKNALPADPLLAMVPVSVRTGNETEMYQNRVSSLVATLATNEPDPLRRLAAVRAGMSKAKSDLKAIPAEALMDFTQFAPPAVAARAMRMISRLRIADRANPPFNVVISNVPGPADPLYSSGAKLLHFYPVSALVDSQGLNITVQSYNGNLDFGLIADRELVPDVWHLTDLLHEAHQELLSASLALAADTADTGDSPKGAKRSSRTAQASTAKKAAARKSPTRTSSARTAPVKKAQRSTAKKATARKAPATKTPAKKAAAKKSSATKATAPTTAAAKRSTP